MDQCIHHGVFHVGVALHETVTRSGDCLSENVVPGLFGMAAVFLKFSFWLGCMAERLNN